MGYRVKTVSALTGLPRGTLLAWERRYAILDPDRSASGYREYTDADVELFRRLKALVDEGYSISEAVDIVRSGRPASGLGGGISGRGAAPPATPPAAPTVPAPEATGAPVQALHVPPLQDDVGALLAQLLAYDRAAADRMVPRLGQVTFQTAIDDVFVPLLHRLGDLWERGEVTIAQEHFVSGFCREHLLAMYHGLGGGPEGGLTVACATPPGERHELGLLVLALRLALAGHRVTWLGADLPVPDLCAYLASQRPRFLCVSFTRPHSRAEVVAYARAVRAGAPPGTDIVLGGPGLEGVGELGIDGVAVVTGFAALQARLDAAMREPWRSRAGSDRVSG